MRFGPSIRYSFGVVGRSGARWRFAERIAVLFEGEHGLRVEDGVEVPADVVPAVGRLEADGDGVVDPVGVRLVEVPTGGSAPPGDVRAPLDAPVPDHHVAPGEAPDVTDRQLVQEFAVRAIDAEGVAVEGRLLTETDRAVDLDGRRVGP